MPIRRFRTSIAGMLGAIALIGVTMAAVMSPSHLWGNAYYTLTATCLVIALIRVIYSRGERRAYAVGFAIAGWAFFLAHYGPAPVSNVAENLITRPILDILYPFTVPTDPNLAVTPPAAPTVWPAGVTPAPPTTIMLNGSQVQLPTQYYALFNTTQTNPVSTFAAWENWTTLDRTTNAPAQFSPGYFRRVLINVMCLALAMAGGAIARHFYRTRDEPAGIPTPTVEPDAGPLTA